MSDAELLLARDEARQRFEHMAHRVAGGARERLKKFRRKLTDADIAELEAMIALTQGKQVNLSEAFEASEDLTAHNKFLALSYAMEPLVEYWEAKHGPATKTVYSNPKKTDVRPDEGASPAVKWLQQEMSNIVAGQIAIGSRTIVTMLEHLGR